MKRKQQVRDILFSNNAPLDWDQKESIVKIGVKMLDESRDRETIIKSIQAGLSDSSGLINSSQIYHFFKKWAENSKPQIREFILSELKDIILSASIGNIKRSDLSDESKAKSLKTQLKADHTFIKMEIYNLLLKKYGEDFAKTTSKKLKVLEYAVVRFFREDRVPTRKVVLDYMGLLGTDEITYQRTAQ